MNKRSVTLCMIVKNEEQYLDKCLNSVRGKVDEIIVVDTGSTDKTIEIAEKHNAIVKHFEWVDDFAAARNYSISEAKMEYILILDADEYLDESCDLQAVLMSDKDYYRLLIKNYQEQGTTMLHQNVRLFRSGIGLSYSGKLHEHLNTLDSECGYCGEDSDIIIHHLGYLPEIINDREKKKRNFNIMLKELADNPSGFSYFNMGISYMNDGQYDKALEMFEKSFPMSKNKSYVKRLLVGMAECLHMMNRTEEGISILIKYINVFNRYLDMHYALGRLYLDLGYLKDAEYEFIKCLNTTPEKENTTMVGVGSYLANYQLALTYEKMGKSGEAFEEVFKAVNGNRQYTPALALYLRLMKRTRAPLEEMQELISMIYPIKNAEELNNLILGLYSARHPLINRYKSVLADDKLTNMRAVAYILEGDYKSSFEEWKKQDLIPEENIIDILVLSLIEEDIFFMDSLKDKLNLSKKEWKMLMNVINKEDMGKGQNVEQLEKVLLEMAIYLLDIDSYEHFSQITRYILNLSIGIQNELALQLIARGHLDTAEELISLNLERYPGDYELYIRAGDLFVAKNDNVLALELYFKSISLRENYMAYVKIFELYERMGNKKELVSIKKKLRTRFPLSIWSMED